jgi:hypothetical protein
MGAAVAAADAADARFVLEFQAAGGVLAARAAVVVLRHAFREPPHRAEMGVSGHACQSVALSAIAVSWVVVSGGLALTE